MERKIRFVFVDDEGVNMNVMVSRSFIETYKNLKKEEARIERKETRRHSSREMLLEKGWEFADNSPDPLNKIMEKEKVNYIEKALKVLTEEQKRLASQVYYEGLSMAEIARREGVDSSAIRHRMKRIREKMKKALSEYMYS